MQEYDKLREAGVSNPCERLKGWKGFYRCCVYKWKPLRKAQQWTLVCKGSERIAKSFHELPNSIRGAIGLERKFNHRKSAGSDEATTTMLPVAFCDAVAETVVSCPWLLVWGIANSFVIYIVYCTTVSGILSVPNTTHTHTHIYIYRDLSAIYINIYIYIYIYMCIFSVSLGLSLA